MTTDSPQHAPVRPKKSLGQNFLKDPHYVRRIAEAAAVSSVDQVLEIGPGLGHLTGELARRAGRVLAIELDERVVPILHDQFAGNPQVEIRQGDALRFAYDTLTGTWKVVANLPYYVATPLIQRMLADRDRFSQFTIMVQKEVAERIAADPGSKQYGYLSVLVQVYTLPRIAFTVPAGAFTPQPKVDSAVLQLAMREHPVIPAEEEDFFFRLVKAAFSQRRKTLRNALAQIGAGSEILRTAELATGIVLTRRAETLSLEEFRALARHISAQRTATS